MKVLLVTFLGIFFSLNSAADLRDDIQEISKLEGHFEAGKTMAAQNACTNCHFTSGDKFHGHHPRIAGQVKKYLIVTMAAFRNGDRTSQGPMNYFLANYTNQQIADLAEYFSSIDFYSEVKEVEEAAP